MGVTLPENFPTGSYGMMNKRNKDIVLHFLPTIDPKFIDGIKMSILVKGQPDDKPNSLLSPSKKRKHPDVSYMI